MPLRRLDSAIALAIVKAIERVFRRGPPNHLRVVFKGFKPQGFPEAIARTGPQDRELVKVGDAVDFLKDDNALVVLLVDDSLELAGILEVIIDKGLLARVLEQEFHLGEVKLAQLVGSVNDMVLDEC